MIHEKEQILTAKNGLKVILPKRVMTVTFVIDNKNINVCMLNIVTLTKTLNNSEDATKEVVKKFIKSNVDLFSEYANIDKLSLENL